MTTPTGFDLSDAPPYAICGACDGDGFVGRGGTIRCRPCRGTGEVLNADQAADDEEARICAAEYAAEARAVR